MHRFIAAFTVLIICVTFSKSIFPLWKRKRDISISLLIAINITNCLELCEEATMSSSSLIMDKPSTVSFLPVKTEVNLSSHGHTNHSQVSLQFWILFWTVKSSIDSHLSLLTSVMFDMCRGGWKTFGCIVSRRLWQMYFIRALCRQSLLISNSN